MTDAFAFGRNWQRYVDRHLDTRAVAEAEGSLRGFLALPSLAGWSFLDIGCGSGLFSLAAHRLGAARVVSFDIDENSVACCRILRARAGNPENWQILAGSILDPEFVARLDPADIVYSWGVLHHTGRMWDAIRAAAERIAPGGLFYIALYNRADGWGLHPDGRFGPSSFWLKEKRLYNRLPRILQHSLDLSAMVGMIGLYVLFLQNPLRKIREHRGFRGMSWSVDITDWLGGYPYEFARPCEVFEFCHRELGLGLQRMKTDNGLRNNEFVFRRP